MRTRVVAVIPARGGSKGVPGKNVTEVGGRPLVARAVAAARAAGHVDRVLVSTDDPLIASAARDAGAEIVDRPVALADDTATSESALRHALDTAAPEAEVVLLVQCTSPFLSADDVDGVAAAVLGGADSAFTAAVSHGFLWRPDGTGVNHDPATRPRRQDRPVELLETGAAYAMRVDGFRRTGHRFFGRVVPVAVDPARTLEIDEPADLDRARLLAPLVDHATSIGLADVDALVLDFDGTLTDDRVVVDQDGRESVTVHRGDGLGIAALRRAGLAVVILSTEQNPVVSARARKLNIPALQGIEAKGVALAQWCADHGHDLARTAYVGNDVNDLPCFDIVGWPIAVADAHHSVRARARIVTAAAGGHGAIREVASRLLGKEIRDGSDSLALHR
ncbi:acylneuraminate cytidylyltransferase [Jatrophihabitans endophyticus]|uniref:acylneuraminate cytidylyltransferase n=1 Tax=Jatrophihabitans endophyticus TaxID=1206085 RepID=UPI0009341577|nr:acylneuraminate cytidylyltransferase [Jatrophihabitans endophyticus]